MNQMTGSTLQLAEICNINLNGVAPLSRYDYRDGDVQVIGNGRKPRGFHDIANVPEMSILVSRTGCYGHVSRYQDPIFVTNEAYYLTEVSPFVDTDYLYVYLKYIASSKLQRRTVRDTKGLSFDRLSRLKIVIPSIPVQQRIAKAYLNLENLGNSATFDKKTIQAIENIQSSISSKSRSSARSRHHRWFTFIKRFMIDIIILVVIALVLLCLFPENRLAKLVTEDQTVVRTMQQAKKTLFETCLSTDIIDDKTCRAITYSQS